MTKIRKECWISSAHVLLDYEGKCSRIHGHNWKVIVIASADTDNSGMVIDFSKISSYISRYDHRFLVPGSSKFFKIIKYKGKESFELAGKYVIPKSDAIVLPVPNITSEVLANYIKRRLQEKFQLDNPTLEIVSVEVQETEGNSAIVG